MSDRQDTAHVLLCEFWGWNHNEKKKEEGKDGCSKITFFEEG